MKVVLGNLTLLRDSLLSVGPHLLWGSGRGVSRAALVAGHIRFLGILVARKQH